MAARSAKKIHHEGHKDHEAATPPLVSFVPFVVAFYSACGAQDAVVYCAGRASVGRANSSTASSWRLAKPWRTPVSAPNSRSWSDAAS